MQAILKDTGTYVKVGVVLLVLSLAGSAYGYYRYSRLHQDLSNTQSAVASSTALFEQRVSELQDKVSQLEQWRAETDEAYRAERDRNEEIAEQIEDISDTVGVLDKLQNTDKELLQKYSKVSFLNEHYFPQNLVSLPEEYNSQPNKELQLRREAWRDLKRLIDRAERDDIAIKIVSAYRDFSTQSSLKAQYKVTYGSGANAFSADQGYSEHQLGTTVDLGTPTTNNALTGFENTQAYAWLLSNAHKYGFILSYPPNNQYYVFEPWHWRFVGVDLATDLHKANTYFYNWDQRKINEYLVNIFD